MFTFCPSDIRMCHCGHLMPKTRVSHITAPAGPLTTSETRKSASSRLLSALWPSFPSKFLLPQPAWPSWKVLLRLQNSESDTASYLPAAAAICLLNFFTFLWAQCPSLALATLSQRPGPSSTTSSRQFSRNFSERCAKYAC